MRRVILHLQYRRELPLLPLFSHMSTANDIYRHVIYKLLGFTFAMIVAPIGSYFLLLNTLFGGWSSCLAEARCGRELITAGNSTYAGAFAAIMANVVLIGYVIVAFQEDQSEALEAAEKEKKESKKGL